jgi:CRISPR system Cascade subunit CasC
MSKITFHVLLSLQNHNMNRDEDGRPKTAEVGGVTRGRISAQSRRRAMRFSPHFKDCQRSTRTRNAGIKTYQALSEAGVKDKAALVLAALTVNYKLGGGGGKPTPKTAEHHIKKFDAEINKRLEEGRIEAGQYEDLLQDSLKSGNGLVVSTREFANLDALIANVSLRPADSDESGSKAVKALVDHLNKNGLLTQDDRDEDVSLFGRMVAADATFNVDAACAVSHAITTHAFVTEGDYWSAGEEQRQPGETGAAITGYAFFGGGVYYQTVVLDLDLLAVNLREDPKRMRRAVAALFDGLVFALPTGKRNSHAADHPASYVMAVRGDAPSVNYLTAFLKPVEPERDEDLLSASIRRLREYHRDIHLSYGLDEETLAFNGYAPSRVDGDAVEVATLKELKDFVLADVGAPAEAAAA